MFFLVVYLYSVGGSSYAVIGGILGVFIASAANVVWGAYWSWKKYSVKPDFRISAKILVSAMFAAAAAYLFINVLSLPYIFQLLGGCVVFLFVYLTVASLIGAINSTDINSLRSMTSNLGLLSKVLNPIFTGMQKICQRGHR